jgi:hypothetical protein
MLVGAFFSLDNFPPFAGAASMPARGEVRYFINIISLDPA